MQNHISRLAREAKNGNRPAIEELMALAMAPDLDQADKSECAACAVLALRSLDDIGVTKAFVHGLSNATLRGAITAIQDFITKRTSTPIEGIIDLADSLDNNSSAKFDVCCMVVRQLTNIRDVALIKQLASYWGSMGSAAVAHVFGPSFPNWHLNFNSTDFLNVITAFPPLNSLHHLHLGFALHRHGRQSESIVHLVQAANAGFDEARAKLGHVYVEGDGVSRDYFEGVQWYLKLFSDPVCQFEAGYFYEDDQDWPVSWESKKWRDWGMLAEILNNLDAISVQKMLNLVPGSRDQLQLMWIPVSPGGATNFS